MDAKADGAPLLRVSDLKTYFHTDAGTVSAVDGVSFDIDPAETLALVGESGCGKSVTAMSILRLLPTPPAEIVSGRIVFDGEDLTGASERRMRRLRGNDISMIFQEPMTSLNPVYTAGDQVMEAVALHRGAGPDEARRVAVETFRDVGIPDPERRVDEYPHQMSGGMRQRVMIAMALSCRPKLLIADEPTTALDVTIQAQILDLLRELQRRRRLSILLITHDLGVVAEMAHRVVVMYAGRICEKAGVTELFERPAHPYTAGLMRSIPKIDVTEERLETIPGVVPDALNAPEGCRFRDRCPYAFEPCVEQPPLTPCGEAREGEGGKMRPHLTACWHAAEHPGFDYLNDSAFAELVETETTTTTTTASLTTTMIEGGEGETGS